MEKDYLSFFNNYYKDTKNKIENAMEKYNNSIIKENDNRIVKELLNDFIDLNSDGKYIRGSLIGLAYNNYVKDDKYIPLSIAYETFETAVLVHDDVIDKGEKRRGKKTIHTRISEKYNEIDAYDYSNSQAMLAGDIAFFMINKHIIDNYKDNTNLYKILDKYNEIVIETIKGEIIDVALPFESKNLDYVTKEKDVLDIYRMKTAKYTILGPFELGLSLLGKDITDNLKEALENIGICFQIKDDILGVFGDSKVMGKPNISDIEEFKQTILYTYTLNTKYKDELLKYYGKKINEKELEEVRQIFRDSKALEYAENKMSELMNIGIENIEKEKELTDETKNILKGLIDYIQKREK